LIFWSTYFRHTQVMSDLEGQPILGTHKYQLSSIIYQQSFRFNSRSNTFAKKNVSLSKKCIKWVAKSFDQLTLQELYDLMALRQLVFVIEQDCPYLDADGKDQHSIHLMGFVNDEIVAYTRIVAPGISYKECSIGRVVSAQSVRGTGIGIHLMEESIKVVVDYFGEVAIRISAQKYLRKFYEKFRFEYVGKAYLEDGIPHIEMLRNP